MGRARYPQAERPRERKPPWLRVRVSPSPVYDETRAIVRRHRLNTVCEEAACPNVRECWAQRHATVMILGDVCTRTCSFCNVATGKPRALDPGEPARLAEAVAELGLEHVVITSVDRDDLPDGGAGQFARCIEALRAAAPDTTVEVLTPDFLRKPGALETVPRLYRSVRPAADYRHSVELLARVRALDPSLFTKSGIMVGLGETDDEVLGVMDDLRASDVDFMTIGQYLQPTLRHIAVERYVPPEEFAGWKRAGAVRGFLLVASSPLTRSSHHAGDDFRRLRAARDARMRAMREARLPTP